MLSIYNIIFENKLNPCLRDDVKVNSKVKIIIKNNGVYQETKIGKVKRLLTKNKKHTRGIKVKLQDGTIGRVLKIY